MRFTLDRDQLAREVGLVKAAVAAPSVNGVLQGILIEAERDRVKFRATDLESDIETATFLEVEESGRALVSGKVLIDLCRKLPNGPVEVIGDDKTLTLKVGKSKIDLAVMPADHYPAPPKVGETALRMERGMLREIIRRTVPFVSRDSSRVWLTGVHFRLQDGKLAAIATDGVRISAVTTEIDSDAGFAVTISSKSLRDLLGVLDGSGPVTFRFGEGHAVFDFSPSTLRVAVRILEGQYPDVLRLVPQSYPHRFAFETDAFLGALERASVVAKDGVKLVLKTEPDGVGFARIEANRAEVGSVYEEVNVVQSEGSLEISFNQAYLGEGIRAVAADKEFALEMSGERTPARIESVIGIDGRTLKHSYIVLPLITL